MFVFHLLQYLHAALAELLSQRPDVDLVTQSPVPLMFYFNPPPGAPFPGIIIGGPFQS